MRSRSSLGQRRAAVLDAEDDLQPRSSDPNDHVLVLGREAQPVFEEVDQGALNLNRVDLHERDLVAR